MGESLVSMGIDIGTSTTQVVFSRLFVENIANRFSIPDIRITGREILYLSDIYMTPLKNSMQIDEEKIRKLLEQEYEFAGIPKETVQTGAVIVTGETARKENADHVLHAVSGLSGDFVVALAGPDLEGILAGKGAGADLLSKQSGGTVANLDMGGGTTNFAVFQKGICVDTGCLDIGGRLIKIDTSTGCVTYISSKTEKIIEKEGLQIQMGKPPKPGDIHRLCTIFSETIKAALGLGDKKYLSLLTTNHGLKEPEKITHITLSGGIGELFYQKEEEKDVYRYGDIGILLAENLKKELNFTVPVILEAREKIRATVIGTGSHTTKVSGATISYRNITFPIKNVPVLSVPVEEEDIKDAIQKKWKWFQQEESTTQVAIAICGMKNPTFLQVESMALKLCEGLKEFRMQGGIPMVILTHDMAKVLGQCLQVCLNVEEPYLCMDQISLGEGDYIDIGKPIADGQVIPVVVKTLAF